MAVRLQKDRRTGRIGKTAVKEPDGAKPPAFDVPGAASRLRAAAARQGLSVARIAAAGGTPGFWLLAPTKAAPGPTRLIMAGVHGDEPAGTTAILRFLESAPRGELGKGNAVFVPMFSEAGLAAGTREGLDGRDPNRGMTGKARKPSAEGRLLLSRAKDAVRWAAGGLLTLHADSDVSGAYVYGYEDDPTAAGSVSRRVIDALATVFPRHKGRVLYGDAMADGIVADPKADGSIEEYIFEVGKAPATITAEVPGKAPLAKREKALVAAVSAFLGAK